MKLLAIILLLLVVAMVTPVAAVTYSDEYYMLTNESTIAASHFDAYSTWNGYMMNWDKATVVELRRQTILMEKQNELLEEQNGLTRRQMSMKLQCTQKGFTMYGGCLEYAWVESGWV